MAKTIHQTKSDNSYCDGIHKLNTTAYHPQTDGLVEWFNCTVIDTLRQDKQSTWDWLRWSATVCVACVSEQYAAFYQSVTIFLSVRSCDPRLPTEEALSKPTDRIEDLMITDLNWCRDWRRHGYLFGRVWRRHSWSRNGFMTGILPVLDSQLETVFLFIPAETRKLTS